MRAGRCYEEDNGDVCCGDKQKKEEMEKEAGAMSGVLANTVGGRSDRERKEGNKGKNLTGKENYR